MAMAIGPIDAVDALFAEAFALLDEKRTPSQRRRPNASSTATRKRVVDDLRDEATTLTDRLQQLSGGGSRHAALTERLKRRRAELERQTLRDALYQQTQFLRGLRGLFLGGSMPSVSLNLHHHLHDFTRLPRDASVRQREYAALRRDQRFLAAIELLRHETEMLPVVESHIETEFVDAPSEPCAITTKSVFVMDGCDVPMVLRAACVALRDIAVRCPAYKWVGTAGEIVDAETLSQSNLQYRLTNIRRLSDRDAEGFSVEARLLTMYKMLGDAAVMLWDYVDEDELHPLDTTPDISKQGVGGCLVRREICPDGVERTVYRELSTRRYVYRGPLPPSPSVATFLASKRSAIHTHERLYRDLMLEQVAIEKAIVGRATPLCGVSEKPSIV